MCPRRIPKRARSLPTKGCETLDGLIVKTHNRFYHVRIDDQVFVCSPKGNFRRHQDPEYRLPVIGDRVSIQLDPKREGVDGYIVAIRPRDNRLVRADLESRKQRVMAANLDRAVIVSAVSEPGVDFALIDRYLVSCALSEIEPVLVMNKIDLDQAFSENPHFQVYRELGIVTLLASAETENGLDDLRTLTEEGISFLTGASGVGKSSLINLLVPGAGLTTGAVDPRGGRGRHTTTFSELISLETGGFIVDSPGLRDFYPPKVPPDEVRFGFQEIAGAQPDCRFPTCLHDEEPGCAVKAGVAQGSIAAFRYKSYLFLMREMRTAYQNRF